MSARYGGDSVFDSSTSNPVSVNVTPESSTVLLFGNTYPYGSTSFVPLTNGGSYPYGTYIAIDAQPHGVNAAPGTNDGVATGTISFTDKASAGTSSSGALALNASGTAEWVPTSGFAVGMHDVAASYSGDVSFDPSSSATALTFTITKIAPGINLCLGNPLVSCTNNGTIASGSSVTLTLIVGITALAAPPTGTATFYLGGKVLGTATLGPPPYYNPSVAAASLTISNLPPGTDNVTAQYAGDTNYEAATSNPVQVTVSQQSWHSDCQRERVLDASDAEPDSDGQCCWSEWAAGSDRIHLLVCRRPGRKLECRRQLGERFLQLHIQRSLLESRNRHCAGGLQRRFHIRGQQCRRSGDHAECVHDDGREFCIVRSGRDLGQHFDAYRNPGQRIYWPDLFCVHDCILSAGSAASARLFGSALGECGERKCSDRRNDHQLDGTDHSLACSTDSGSALACGAVPHVLRGNFRGWIAATETHSPPRNRSALADCVCGEHGRNELRWWRR